VRDLPPYLARQLVRMIEKYRSSPMKYLVEVFWSDDDEGYIAVVPDLPGCSAFDTTPKAAVHKIGDAIEAWIAACRASGDPVPEPTTKARQAA
jgi:antitoxin HicB